MVTFSLIRKWKKMLTSTSVFHVVQNEGKYYSVDELQGYYNDLTSKLELTNNIDERGIPFNIAESKKEKKKVYFPITIFQYGLANYDMWISSNEKKYFDIFLKQADWALEHQKKQGEWDSFGIMGHKIAVSSMAQGEGASLLSRAYKVTNKEKYKSGCVRACEFMLRPISEGGTAVEKNGDLFLYEYPDKALVLNGWIFSTFGLFDCWKITNDNKYEELYIKSLNSIARNLNNFDNNGWTYYSLDRKIASPFYHKLHIELLKACYSISQNEKFALYAKKWELYRNKKMNKQVAFIKKVIQKVFENDMGEWVLVE